MERVRVGMKKCTKVAKVAKMEERAHGRSAVARMDAKGKRKVVREKPEHVGLVVIKDTMLRGVEKGGNHNLYIIDADDRENVEETLDNDEDLQPWCLSEGIEIELWQEVIS